MKFVKVHERFDVNTDKTIGFVRITEIENAQQVRISAKDIATLGRLSSVLEKLGFEYITITIEKNFPLVIGGKDIGIGIATTMID